MSILHCFNFLIFWLFYHVGICLNRNLMSQYWLFDFNCIFGLQLSFKAFIDNNKFLSLGTVHVVYHFDWSFQVFFLLSFLEDCQVAFLGRFAKNFSVHILHQTFIRKGWLKIENIKFFRLFGFRTLFKFDIPEIFNQLNNFLLSLWRKLSWKFKILKINFFFFLFQKLSWMNFLNNILWRNFLLKTHVMVLSYQLWSLSLSCKGKVKARVVWITKISSFK